MIPYRVKYHLACIPTADYIGRFRNAEKFIGFCRQCSNYGHSWACPPFDREVDQLIGSYRHTLILACQVFPTGDHLPFAESGNLLRPERRKAEALLRQMEGIFNGQSFAYAGSCLYCPEQQCARICGEPCRHPDLVRPSLEAVGFDLGKTATDLLHIDLLWSKDGFIPEYLTLISGFLHNSDPETVRTAICGSISK